MKKGVIVKRHIDQMNVSAIWKMANPRPNTIYKAVRRRYIVPNGIGVLTVEPDTGMLASRALDKCVAAIMGHANKRTQRCLEHMPEGIDACCISLALYLAGVKNCRRTKSHRIPLGVISSPWLPKR